MTSTEAGLAWFYKWNIDRPGSVMSAVLLLTPKSTCCESQALNRISPTIDEVELRRVCGIMEELSNRHELSDAEQQALETAAIALMAANLTNALKASYKKLADAHNGNIPEDIRNDMLAHGIDMDSLESD